ncbi:helix-turn-helix transcriptional regulator [Streptacidiphilus sp. PAMC 29251]
MAAIGRSPPWYHDQSHFNLAFRQMIGCTPGQFRAEPVHSDLQQTETLCDHRADLRLYVPHD